MAENSEVQESDLMGDFSKVSGVFADAEKWLSSDDERIRNSRNVLTPSQIGGEISKLLEIDGGVKNRVMSEVLTRITDLLPLAEKYGASVPSKEFLSKHEDSIDYFEKVQKLEEDLCFLVLDHGKNEEIRKPLSKMVGNIYSLINTLASKTGDPGHEGFANRLESARSVFAIAVALEDMGYSIDFGTFYLDAGMGIDLVVYSEENSLKPLFFVDVKSYEDSGDRERDGKLIDEIRVLDYDVEIDKKRDGRRRRAQKWSRLDKITDEGFHKEVPHLVIEYPRNSILKKFFSDFHLGIPSEEGVGGLREAFKVFFDKSVVYHSTQKDVSREDVDLSEYHANMVESVDRLKSLMIAKWRKDEE